MNHLFDNISSKNKEKLLKNLESTTFIFKKNIDISSLALDPNNIAIIEYGSVQMIKNDYNGNHIILEDLIENDIFGSIVFPITSEHSIQTKEETKITIIDYSSIIQNENFQSHYYHQFIQNLLKLVIHKIHEKNDRIEILTKKTIRDKLLEYFKIVSKRKSARIIYLPFTFTELADYLAVDRSAMTREMKYLKEEKLIEVEGRKITLLYDRGSMFLSKQK